MIDTEKIEDAMIARIKGGLPGLKTVEPYEAKYDQSQVSQMLILSPFVLVHFGGLDVDEEKRLAGLASGTVEEIFEFTVGAKSLRSPREGQVGAYGILRTLKSLFDGKLLEVDGVKIPMGLVSERFVSSQDGLLVYSASYKMFQL
jgi:phage gp37-like protein